MKTSATRLIVCALVVAASVVSGSNHSFGIAHDGSCLLRDGSPARLVSGCFHYYRAPQAEWAQRLDMFVAAGFDTLQTYVAWNWHCPDEPGECDFTGDRDLGQFLALAHARNLSVVLRPGPFICAEWEFGGFPAWLLRNDSNAPVRTNDPIFMAHVNAWFDILMPIVEPFLFAPHGGPVVMVQLENEYGTFGDDKGYLLALKDALVSRLGNGALIFSTDSDDAQHMRNSAVPGVFQAVDFFYWGTPRAAMNITGAWSNQRAGLAVTNTPGPHFNAEFYPGWYGSWTSTEGYPWHSHSYVDWIIDSVLAANRNASLNFYMGFGGTNFGPWSALPVTTSYDYNAPVNESGHPGRIFHHVRASLSLVRGEDLPPVPEHPSLRGFGAVALTSVTALADAQGLVPGPPVVVPGPTPLAMERVNQSYGMIRYTPSWPPIIGTDNATCVLDLGEEPRDYVMVYDGPILLGHLIRTINRTIGVPLSAVASGSLSLVVENMGRAKMWKRAAGARAGAAKGLVQALRLTCGAAGVSPTSYAIARMPMAASNVMRAAAANATSAHGVAANDAAVLLRGVFALPPSPDVGAGTMFTVAGFRKGSMYVNGHSLGRYWVSAGGPQNSMFCPASFLIGGVNAVVVLEEEPGSLPFDPTSGFPFINTTHVNHNKWLDHPPF